MYIPVMHCFDNNYCMPAAVSFYSMLENANQEYFYKLYVLHSDITEENQEKLREVVKNFKNASLEFIDMKNKFKTLFDKTTYKGRYSKEIYYKYLASSIFPEYEKIIITDVDVCFVGDISEHYLSLNVDEDYYFLGAKWILTKGGRIDKHCTRLYSKCGYTYEEQQKALSTCAGYWIFNLKKMREDNIEEKLIKFTEDNYERIIQPEQDTVNLVCYPKIKFLPPNAVAVTYYYETFKTEEDYLSNMAGFTPAEIKYALKNPVQIHYVTQKKPWNSGGEKSEIWFQYLSKTPYLKDFIDDIFEKLNRPAPIIKYQNAKRVLSFKIPALKRKFTLLKEKINTTPENCGGGG